MSIFNNVCRVCGQKNNDNYEVCEKCGCTRAEIEQFEKIENMMKEYPDKVKAFNEKYPYKSETELDESKELKEEVSYLTYILKISSKVDSELRNQIKELENEIKTLKRSNKRLENHLRENLINLNLID